MSKPEKYQGAIFYGHPLYVCCVYMLGTCPCRCIQRVCMYVRVFVFMFVFVWRRKLLLKCQFRRSWSENEEKRKSAYARIELVALECLQESCLCFPPIRFISHFEYEENDWNHSAMLVDFVMTWVDIFNVFSIFYCTNASWKWIMVFNSYIQIELVFLCLKHIELSIETSRRFLILNHACLRVGVFIV